MKFRIGEVGLTSDIKQAFLQISVAPEHRDFLKFLWWSDVDKGRVKVYRHRRVVFGVSSSPFLLGATIDYHLNHVDIPGIHKELVKKLKSSFYVDNCVTSISKVELVEFVRVAREVMQLAQFDLRGWVWSESAGDINIVDVKPNFNVIPVLGMLWDPKTDMIYCNLPECKIEYSKPVTKRKLLSICQSVFDVLGILSLVTLIPKLILQDTWRLQVGWDERVPLDIERKFHSWLKQLQFVRDSKIPRYFCGCVSEEMSLHIFCDASENAYASCIFLRIGKESEVKLFLVLAKARVAPLKTTITIPRLELMPALIGTRLSVEVKKALESKNIKCFYWTDSMIALSWIKRKDKWNTFVGNRCKEINEHSNTEDWYFVPGSMNPADLPSRGCYGKSFNESRWRLGPEWLSKPPEYWPNEQPEVDENQVISERCKTSVVNIIVNSEAVSESYFAYFNKYLKLVRMIGWIFRFVYNCRNTDKRCRKLSVSELDNVERVIFAVIQLEAFPNGILEKSIASLCPFEDELGLLRMKSKIVYREDKYNFRFPVILPAKHSVVTKLIRWEQEQAKHIGAQGLLSILRERFWIIGGKRTVRCVTSKCISCRRFSAKSIETPGVPLPLNRVRDAAVFEVVGVGLAGPLMLRNGEKVWITLFTCAVYRAVHLELLSSLSTETFLMVLRRFIARRGRPTFIYSDNGLNFVGTENIFSRLDWNSIAQYSSAQRIQWKFNPPTASWWGGWWERLIGL